MSKKIRLEVCSGTACFVMGGSDLLTIFEYLTQEEQDRVSLAAVPCFEHCRGGDNLRPPFVVIDGTVYDKMSINRLSGMLKDMISPNSEE